MDLKQLLHFIVSLAANGAIWAVVPEDYKPYAILLFNLVQVGLAYIDPTYTIQKLGMSKGEFLGKVSGK